MTPLGSAHAQDTCHAHGAFHRGFDGVAAKAGVDGLITVDLPPEEDAVLRVPAAAQQLDIIRLATPTTDENRLQQILTAARGFLYYVSVAGVTGTKSFTREDVRKALALVKSRTTLPCAVGFGISTPEQAAQIAQFADGAVVGSAIVTRIADGLKIRARRASIVKDVIDFCASLAEAVHSAR